MVMCLDTLWKRVLHKDEVRCLARLPLRSQAMIQLLANALNLKAS